MDRKSKTILISCIAGGSAVLVFGVVFFVYQLMSGLSDLEKTLIRIQAPGRETVPLEQSGEYTIFLETSGKASARVLESYTSATGLSVRIESKDGGTVPVGPSGMSETYSLGGRHGTGFLAFTIESPGPYTVTTSFSEDTPVRPLTLTLSQGFFNRVLSLVIHSIVVLFVALAAAGLMILIGILKGVKRKKKTGPPVSGIPPPIT